jgi:hypothetical protein
MAESLFSKNFSTNRLTGDFEKAYGNDPNVVGYYYDESTGQMHAKMKNGSIATYGANFKQFQQSSNATTKVFEQDDTPLSLGTSLVQPPPPTPPTPTIAPVVSTPPPPPAKTAPIDTVLFDDDSVPIEVMTDLIFENIGGQELINITRNDIVNGQKISYSPIKNLTSIQQQYNPNNIVSLQSTSDKYFANFSIKLDQKVPNQGNGPDGSNIYIDESTGDLIIETVNTESDEQVDVQVAISGTIYEADI